MVNNLNLWEGKEILTIEVTHGCRVFDTGIDVTLVFNHSNLKGVFPPPSKLWKRVSTSSVMREPKSLGDSCRQRRRVTFQSTVR